MKKVTLLFSILAISISGLLAQVDIDNYSFAPSIEEASRTMSQGDKNAFVVRIDGFSKKELGKEWEKYVKGYKTKSKYDKKKKEYFADNATIGSISSNTIDIYNQIIESDKRGEIIVWFDLGGAYLSSAAHAEQIAAAEDWVKGFAQRMENKRLEDLQKAEENTLKGLNKDLKNLQKDKEKMENNIKDWEKKIEEAKKSIEENVKNQELKTESIKAQETVVDKVKKLPRG